jgi:hypothetical protein
MHIFHQPWRRLILVAVVCLGTPLVTASDEPTLSKEQITQFLLTAKVVKSEHTKKGITEPWRLTLTARATTLLSGYRRTQDKRDPGERQD